MQENDPVVRAKFLPSSTGDELGAAETSCVKHRISRSGQRDKISPRSGFMWQGLGRGRAAEVASETHQRQGAAPMALPLYTVDPSSFISGRNSSIAPGKMVLAPVEDHSGSTTCGWMCA